MKTLTIFLISFILLLGCSTVSQHAHFYQKTSPIIQIESNVDIALGVQDRRHYVVSGAKSEKYVGQMSRGVGILY